MNGTQFAVDAVRETLGKSTDVDSCMALAAHIDGLLDQAREYFQKDDENEKGGVRIACRVGCNFCCHLRVMVYPHEAIALFRYLGARMPEDVAAVVRRRVAENAARITEMTREGRGVTGMACAFLVDGKCSAYEVRPAACSGYHSLSREKCEAAHGQLPGSAEAIPMLQALRHVAATLDEGMDQALAATKLDTTRVELHTAVAALIRNPALIAKWRAGRELIKSAPGAA
jgi:Fe-S-cluster containining protein